MICQALGTALFDNLSVRATEQQLCQRPGPPDRGSGRHRLLLVPEKERIFFLKEVFSQVPLFLNKKNVYVCEEGGE